MQGKNLYYCLVNDKDDNIDLHSLCKLSLYFDKYLDKYWLTMLCKYISILSYYFKLMILCAFILNHLNDLLAFNGGEGGI